MNYEQMSDFEINKAAGIALGIDLSGINQDNYQMYNIKNYCNSWADAGPIIERERITITSALRRDWWDAIDISADIEVRHVNPLRAAMIVFLMMQDKK